MNPRPLYIFDLDGTLRDLAHRRHLVETSTPDWRAFYAACKDDKPITATITLLRTLLQADADVWIFSGCSDEVREITEAWIDEHIGTWFDWIDHPEVLTMREAGDFTADDKLKRSWYEAMLPEDRARLVCVFDDRDRVVNMWRSLGVQCLQVAPGSF